MRNAQSDQPSLQAMFQEDALLRARPVDVVQQNADLRILGVRDGVEELEKSTDC